MNVLHNNNNNNNNDDEYNDIIIEAKWWWPCFGLVHLFHGIYCHCSFHGKLKWLFGRNEKKCPKVKVFSFSLFVCVCSCWLILLKNWMCVAIYHVLKKWEKKFSPHYHHKQRKTPGWWWWYSPSMPSSSSNVRFIRVLPIVVFFFKRWATLWTILSK